MLNPYFWVLFKKSISKNTIKDNESFKIVNKLKFVSTNQGRFCTHEKIKTNIRRKEYNLCSLWFLLGGWELMKNVELNSTLVETPTLVQLDMDASPSCNNKNTLKL